MRRAIGLCIPAILCAATPAAAAPANIAGDWKTDDGRAIVTVAPCRPGASALCATISRFLVAEPAGGARDTLNPDPKLRSRRLLGSAVLTGLVPKGDAWVGQGYSARDGRNFKATITGKGGRFNLKGCVLFICKSVVWSRP